MTIKQLEAKLQKARQEANEIYDACGLGPQFEAAMDAVRELADKLDCMTEIGDWDCDADGKWWA